jgi:hypothetical protein
MSWKDLLSSGEEVTLPWVGGRKVHNWERTWNILGALPLEYGWYTFEISGGRGAELKEPIELVEPNLEFENKHRIVRGYLVGDRVVPDNARVDPDPNKLIRQTKPVFLVEYGLERFARAVSIVGRDRKLIYMRQEFPEGPELEVQEAYQDRLESLDHICGVSPALDLAFRWVSYQRIRIEERQRELERRRVEEERKREEEERMRQAMQSVGTGIGRRVLAGYNFNEAAKAALSVSGAEFLDARELDNHEMVVQYRFMNRRLECIVEKLTLRVLDAGICLTDEYTGEKGDTYFTLESLPAVVGQAINENVLVIYRHI